MKPAGLLLFLLLFNLSFSISGQILNRSFELTVNMEPNGLPLYWDQQHYTRVHNIFYPQTERKKELDWHIEYPMNGDFFLVMNTGAWDTQNDATVSVAQVWQQVYLPAWTLIRGFYFFGTSDYRPYYDYGAIKLIPFVDPNNPCDPNDPNNIDGCPQLIDIEIARCSVNEVGDFGSTVDWVPFSYTILPQQEGMYTIQLLVRDGTDSVYESFFAIDGLSICGPMTPLGDINQDCYVDMEDLSCFSKEWLKICSIDPNGIQDPNDPDIGGDPNNITGNDPNTLTDPNCMCADFDRNNIVDSNDLYPLHDNWLISDI